MSFLKDLRVFHITFRNPNIIFLYTVISFPPENYLEPQGEDNLSVLGELSLFSFLLFKSFAMRPTIQLKKIYRNFTFSNWTCKSFRSINRRVARSLTFSQIRKLPLYSPFTDTALKFEQMCPEQGDQVCTRELPSSLHKKANPNYFKSVMIDTLMLPRQINTWEKGQGWGW